MGQRRWWPRTERAILGVMMGLAAAIMERRLRKALRKIQAAPKGGSVTFGPEEGRTPDPR